MLTETPWDLAPHLPWSHFTSPLAKWAVQPSFVIAEYTFYLCTAIALVHALRRGRAYLLVFVAALLAGTANDIIFMALPVVDNFWQAQGTVMLTPRLPLYIPCVYICFMYFPTVSVWRLGLPRLAQAALTGLLAELFYAPYDINGAKFLWWTWHDTDMPIAHRLLGAPVGSSLWVVMFVATFAFLISFGTRKDPELRGATIAKTMAMVMALSTVLMVVQMNIIQPLDGGVPGPRGALATIVVYGLIVAWGWSRREDRGGHPADRLLHRAVVFYYLVMTLVMAVFDPATHRSESMHQTYGPCHVEAVDIMGFTRYQYVCAEDFDEDYNFNCAPPPPEMSEWYTVCGEPHRHFPTWMTGVAMLSGLGILMYSFLLAGAPREQ